MKLCKPYRSPLQAVFIMVFTAVLVLMTAFIIPYFPDIALYLRLFGGVALLVGAVVLFRFTMTEFVYGLNGDTLTVRRILGLSNRTVFSVTLTEKTAIYTKREFKTVKTHGGKSYRQNLTANTAFLVYEVGGKKRHVELEPNNEFFALVKKRIDDKRSE